MRITSATSNGGVCEQLFTHDQVPGVLWTPENAAGPRPLILMGHGGGQHKRAPGIVARANRFVTECGFAVTAVDVPGHGDRPMDEEYDRIATENQIRVDAGEELAPLIAGFHAFVARQTVPEWRAVLDAVQELEHVGAGPVGYWGVSLGCGREGSNLWLHCSTPDSLTPGSSRNGFLRCRSRITNPRSAHSPGLPPGAEASESDARGGDGRTQPGRRPAAPTRLLWRTTP